MTPLAQLWSESPEFRFRSDWLWSPLKSYTRPVDVLPSIATTTDAPLLWASEIAEFASPDAPVRSRAPSGDEARYTLKELLPHAFTHDFL